MDTTKLIILGVVIVLVVGINFGLILAALRGRFSRDIDMYSQLARRVKDPWQEENQDLEELSRLVRQLKDPDEEKKLEEDY